MVANEAAINPGKSVVSMIVDNDFSFSDSEVGPKVPFGYKIVHAIVKMRQQVGPSGIPEIGIIVSPKKGSSESAKKCFIKKVVPGSPAHRCGNIRAGDVVIRVNSMDVTRMDTEETIAFFRKTAIDSGWTYGPIRLQLLRRRDVDMNTSSESSSDEEDGQPDAKLMTLMSIAVRKNSQMVSSKKPNPIRHTLLQRTFCDRLDKALLEQGYYDTVYQF